MENKETKLIVKILLIIGVVFVGLSLLAPWLGAGGYLWGSSIFGQTSVFYIDFIGLLGGYGILLMVSTLITFILVIIALILGLRAIKNVERYKSDTSISAGIVSLISMIFLAIALNIGDSILGGGLTMGGMSFDIGFYMMIIPTILFFTAGGVQKALLSTPTPPITQQPMYQQNVVQQPVQPTVPPIQPAPQTPPATALPQQQQMMMYYETVSQKVDQKLTETASFCPECGAKLEPDAKFCAECGNSLE